MCLSACVCDVMTKASGVWQKTTFRYGYVSFVCTVRVSWVPACRLPVQFRDQPISRMEGSVVHCLGRVFDFAGILSWVRELSALSGVSSIPHPTITHTKSTCARKKTTTTNKHKNKYKKICDYFNLQVVR